MLRIVLSPAFIMLTALCGSQAIADDRVTIKMRAFIPNKVENNPGYTRPVPSQANKWMIPGPLKQFTEALGVDLSAACFLTDSRGFSSASEASSRVESSFDLIVEGASVSISPSDPRQVHRAGISTEVDCHSGAVISEKPGTFAGPFGVRAIGKPALADRRAQIIGQVGIGNPHVLGAPMIDYSFDFIYDTSSHQLRYSITVGKFPAFETYASRAGGKPVEVLKVVPEAGAAWGLMDGGLGLRSGRYTGTVQLP